jgi:hypothetical protein
MKSHESLRFLQIRQTGIARPAQPADCIGVQYEFGKTLVVQQKRQNTEKEIHTVIIIIIIAGEEREYAKASKKSKLSIVLPLRRAPAPALHWHAWAFFFFRRKREFLLIITGHNFSFFRLVLFGRSGVMEEESQWMS